MISIPHITHEHTHTRGTRPYRPLLVVSPREIDGRQLPEDPAIGLALRLDISVDANSCREALQRLITGERPFLVLMDTSTSDSRLFEYIALCLFSPNYLRIGDTPVLAFHPSLPDDLIIYLQAQGFTGIIQWNTHPSRWLTRQQQAAHIAGTLVSGAPAPKYIFIRGKGFDDSLLLEQELHRQCGCILDDNPELQSYLMEKHQLEESLDILKKENNVLQERLRNAETTVGIIRSKYKDDYDILFNWYQQEYEVLPGWYKRFGQLIKVLTGKRTAKSLFQAFRRRLHRWAAPNMHPKKDKT
jgi:hypothetical protein